MYIYIYICINFQKLKCLQTIQLNNYTQMVNELCTKSRQAPLGDETCYSMDWYGKSPLGHRGTMIVFNFVFAIY